MVGIGYNISMASWALDHDNEPKDTLGQRIRYARLNAGMTQKDVAEMFEIDRVNVSQWESDTTRPDLAKIPQLAERFGVDEAWLLTGSGKGPDKAKDKSRGARWRGWSQNMDEQKKKPDRQTQPVEIVPGEQLVGTGRMPVYAAAMGGDGHVIVTFEPVDDVKRPAELENVRGGYGLLLTGESMIPAFWPGDMALVNPNLQPARSKNVILYHTPPNGGDVEAMVKQLNGWTDREWLLQQYNPFLEFKEFRQEWPICHRVVGRYDAR